MKTDTTIKCPHCGKNFEPSDAFTHSLQEAAIAKERSKFEKDLAKIKKEISDKTASEFELKFKNLQKEKEEERERNTKLLKQLENLNDELRILRRKDEERELDMKKKLAIEEEKIRNEERRRASEEHTLKDKEKDKKLEDALKQIEEMKIKMQQGSQQTQGEVMELEMEQLLLEHFPTDTISEVKKGQRGADIVQIVIDKKGRNCGTILWESKNAKWSDKWISKLKDDQRAAKADLAVLVSEHLPDNSKSFSYHKGVWITPRTMFIALATALRFDLVRVNYERLTNVGKNEKMEILYSYITSTEFKHRIEAITESFNFMQDEIEREKRWFNTKWARQEKALRKVFDNTHGMLGDLQGTLGKSMPEIKTLQLLEGNE